MDQPQNHYVETKKPESSSKKYNFSFSLKFNRRKVQFAEEVKNVWRLTGRESTRDLFSVMKIS